MKMHRLALLLTLIVLVCIGLLSMPFLPSIEAALTPSSAHRTGADSIYLHTPVPAKTMTMLTPTQTTAMSTLLAQDTFQRTDQLYWGMASNGQTWGGDANSNPHFVIANHMGRIVHGHSIYNATLGPRVMNVEVVFSGSLSRFQHANLGSALRWTDVNNWYKAYIDGMHLVLLKDVAGTMTTLDSVSFPAVADTSYTLRFRIVGSQLLARAWPTGQAEPSTWMAQATDMTFSSGFAGLRLVVEDGAEATITSFTESAVTNPW